MRLQILGFSQVQKYDSWITNKPLYPINIGARWKGAEHPELLVYLYFNIFLDFLKCWQGIFSHSWVPSLPISWRSNYLGGPMKVVTFGHFPGKVRFKTNFGFPIRSSISYYLSHQCKCLIWSYSLYLSSFLYISWSFHGAETAIRDSNQYLLQVSTENRINSFI